jgi:hypothetical protein
MAATVTIRVRNYSFHCNGAEVHRDAHPKMGASLIPFVGRFGPHAGLVTSRQIFVCRCHLGWQASGVSARYQTEIEFTGRRIILIRIDRFQQIIEFRSRVQAKLV